MNEQTSSLQRLINGGQFPLALNNDDIKNCFDIQFTRGGYISRGADNYLSIKVDSQRITNNNNNIIALAPDPNMNMYQSKKSKSKANIVKSIPSNHSPLIFSLQMIEDGKEQKNSILIDGVNIEKPIFLPKEGEIFIGLKFDSKISSKKVIELGFTVDELGYTKKIPIKTRKSKPQTSTVKRTRKTTSKRTRKTKAPNQYSSPQISASVINSNNEIASSLDYLSEVEEELNQSLELNNNNGYKDYSDELFGDQSHHLH